MPRMSELNELIKGLPAIPFLFVGSGLTRRYYGLPDWRGLLDVFVRRLRGDDFALARYENMAASAGALNNGLAKVAELIGLDFDKKWFDDRSIRDMDEEYVRAIEEGTPPFKAEIATYIRRKAVPVPEYESEIAALKSISQKSLSGIITTNYDCFLETVMDGYTTYIGQEELIFSSIQGLAEIYKIHGCITRPSSIVITATDYDRFSGKNQYLASKLMTIFLEYPIIFIGYALGDNNIRAILKSVIDCLSDENIAKLRGRFIFIERGDNTIPEIKPYLIDIDGKTLIMTKIRLSNYELLYNALAQKRSTYPVKLLRFMKQECYNYVLTHKSTTHFRVAPIDDERLDEEGVAIAVGTLSMFAPIGLRGVTAEEWYRHIVLDDLNFVSPEELLEGTFPKLNKQSKPLPVHKLLSKATQPFPLAQEAAAQNFDALISASIIKAREKVVLPPNRSVGAIWNQSASLEKKTRHIAHLYQHEIDVDALEEILVGLYKADSNILSNSEIPNNTKSHIRRLIRIYDFLKYGQKKSPGSSDQSD